MTHQNTLLTQTQMCPKGFDDEQGSPKVIIDHSITVENQIGFRFGDNYSSSRLQTTCVDGYKFVIVRGPKSISVVQFWEQVRGVPGTASQPAKC